MAVVLMVVAVARIDVHWSVLSVSRTLATTVLGAVLLSAISMVLASAVRGREQFMGIGQLVTPPLFFASNALYSTSIMPAWPTPTPYQVEVMPRLLLGVGPNRSVLDVAVLQAGTVVAVAAATRLYPRRVM